MAFKIAVISVIRIWRQVRSSVRLWICLSFIIEGKGDDPFKNLTVFVGGVLFLVYSEERMKVSDKSIVDC